MYSTSAMLYVQNYNAKSQSNQENGKIFSSDISGSASLAEAYIVFLNNSDSITSLFNDCDVSITNDSFFITVTVSGSDPQTCANVANQICETAGDVFADRFAYGQIGIVRSAQVPNAPYEPNNLKNALIGLVIGLVASVLISILLELIDLTVKPDDDLQEMYDIPIFAEIPDFGN
jgi:capsular polysaccharide biosynthesis protein